MERKGGKKGRGEERERGRGGRKTGRQWEERKRNMRLEVVRENSHFMILLFITGVFSSLLLLEPIKTSFSLPPSLLPSSYPSYMHLQEQINIVICTPFLCSSSLLLSLLPSLLLSAAPLLLLLLVLVPVAVSRGQPDGSPLSWPERRNGGREGGREGGGKGGRG